MGDQGPGRREGTSIPGYGAGIGKSMKVGERGRGGEGKNASKNFKIERT